MRIINQSKTPYFNTPPEPDSQTTIFKITTFCPKGYSVRDLHGVPDKNV